jgi:Tfp pilus assembly protein PilO
MKLNWSSLTKEQKQIAMLIGVGVLVTLALLYQFALVPLLDSMEQRRQDTAKLRDDLARATAALKQEVRAQMESLALKAQLDKLTRTAVAPYGNTFAWVTEQLYQATKDSGVELEGLSGSGQPLGTPATSDPSGRTFTAFSAQMTLQCGYGDLLRFLRCLEGRNPLVTVVNIAVDGRAQSPERHQVSLSLEWPTWVQPPSATNTAMAGKAGKP